MNSKQTEEKFNNIKSKIKDILFVQKINKKKMLFKRRNEREMEKDEIEKYTFMLFTAYSTIIIIPIILFIFWIN